MYRQQSSRGKTASRNQNDALSEACTSSGSAQTTSLKRLLGVRDDHEYAEIQRAKKQKGSVGVTRDNQKLDRLSTLIKQISLLKHIGEVDLDPYVSQREAGDDEIFTLQISGGNYTLASREGPPRTQVPNGEYLFVILTSNPFEVICARTRYFLEFGFGHTSVTRREPVIFAGAVFFSTGGVMTHWTNQSGHYKIPSIEAETQLLPWAKHLLPMHKFKPVD